MCRARCARRTAASFPKRCCGCSKSQRSGASIRSGLDAISAIEAAAAPGLAFTDDVHIHDYARRWGISIRQPTSGEAYAERTATVVWRVLSRITLPVFLWNVLPLHPHEPGNHFSNRLHNNLERKAGEQLLAHVIGLLEPRRLVAIGNDAARVVSNIGAECEVLHVRHPSYGGQGVFVLRCVDGTISMSSSWSRTIRCSVLLS